MRCRLSAICPKGTQTKGNGYIVPVKNIADTPIFLRRGNCKAQTAGSGSMTKYRSLITLTAPVVTDDACDAHCGAARAVI